MNIYLYIAIFIYILYMLGRAPQVVIIDHLFIEMILEIEWEARLSV